MGRAFNFSDSVRMLARARQGGVCAVLGCELDEDDPGIGHHVVPNQSGDPHAPGDAWLRGVDNCVIVCSMCHMRVHEDGRTQSGAVAPASYYEYSHGDSPTARAQHLDWAFQLERRATSVWDRLGARRGR